MYSIHSFKSFPWAIVVLALFADVALAAKGASPKSANPNDNDATLPLAVHGDGVVATLQQGGQERFKIMYAVIDEALTKKNRNQIDRIDPQELGRGNMAMIQMQRIAEQLSVLGEPAGPEFSRRSQYGSQYYSVAQAYAASQEGSVYVAKIRQILNNSQKQRAGIVKKLEDMVAKGNWEDADTLLNDVMDKLASVTIFLTPDEQTQYYQPFSKVSGPISQGIQALRREAAQKIFAERIEAQTPDFDQLLDDVKNAATNIASKGVTTIGDKEVDGPAAFAHFAQVWAKTHASVQRVYGIFLASRGEIDASGNLVFPQARSNTPQQHPVVKRYTESFTREISDQLAALIKADASRADAETSPKLFTEYLKVAALPAGRAGTDLPAQLFREALQELAAKAPAFAANADDYASSTGELLRWRQRLAEAQARSLDTKYATWAQTIQTAARNDKSFYALYLEVDPDFEVPRFLAATPAFLPEVSKRVANVKVRVSGNRGIGKSGVSGITMRTYSTNKAASEALESQLAALRSDLFVADDAEPLTLDSAMAIQSAQLGDFVTMGGKVTGLHLESFLARIAALPDGAAPMIPLGVVPPNPRTAIYHDMINHALPRADISPQWVQHRYFFARIGE